MRKNIIFFAMSALLGIPAAAQDLNPTVEVTNTYEGKLDVGKPAREMAVPDSLLRFDLDFDYTTFENPYRGGFDFAPYLMDMKPVPDTFTGGKFYLRAGSGYAVRPTLDLVWTPAKLQGPFRLNLYATHRSYWGDYRVIRQNSVSEYKFTGDYTTGHDSYTRAGANGRYGWDGGSLTFDLAGLGVNTRHEGAFTNMTGADALVNVKSSEASGGKFYYDASLHYRCAQDDYKFLSSYTSLGINEVDLHGTVGPVLDDDNRILVDAGVRYALYNKAMDAGSGDFYVIPQYRLDSDRLNILLGARVGFTTHSGGDLYGNDVNSSRGQIIYPHVKLAYEAIIDRMDIYVNVLGGERMNTYSDIKESNRFFNIAWAAAGYPLLENSIERVNVSAGIRGNIASVFRYDVRGGFVPYHNGLVEGMGMYYYKDYNLVYGHMDFVLDTRPFIFDGTVDYRHTNIWNDSLGGFAPSAFSGNIRARYNLRKRLYAGVEAVFASKRKGFLEDRGTAFLSYAEVPGYVDLGLEAEYAFNRNWSLWGRIGNLLDQSVQPVPGISERGINFTAGICLNL